ncbi:MAG: discoidin domain-containing protein [Candidatus Dormibacteria bacterium]
MAMLFMLVGCDVGGTPSALTADQSVRVHGQLIGPDRKPVPGTRVALYRRPGAFEAVGNFFTVVASVGLACLADNGPQLCRDARRTVSADDGTFSFTMKGSETYEGGGHDAASFDLSAALPARGDQLTGPDTVEGFKIQVADLQVPDVHFWQPQLTFAGSGPSARLTWSALPAGFGDRPIFEAEFEDPTGNLIWAYPDLQSPAALDARMLEDHNGGVAVHARPHQVGIGTVFEFDYRTPSVIFRGSAGAPISRQRACYVAVDTSPPVRQHPCTLTDGDIGALFQPQTGCVQKAGATPCPSAQTNAPYVDLGAPASVDLVVVHGCATTCLVDTSTDAVRWTPAGGSAGTVSPPANGLAAIPLTPGTRARYLRAGVGVISNLTEVSVWGASGQPLPPPTEPAPPPPRPLSSGGHRASVALSDAQFRLLLIVNVLGLPAIGALVVALIRRRAARPSAR